MVENFRKNFGAEMAYITTGLTPHQTVTLASIVETEAQLPAERALVASVYLNRIRKHMLLGVASLRAAAAPASTNFLYFVARPDRSHAFSTNLNEHNHNVEIYQRRPARQAQKKP